MHKLTQTIDKKFIEATWKNQKKKLEARKIGSGYSIGIFRGKTRANGMIKWTLEEEYLVGSLSSVYKQIKNIDSWMVS